MCSNSISLTEQQYDIAFLHAQSPGNTPAAVAALCYALVSALLMNVCIVGINQLYDVEIDKVRTRSAVAPVTSTWGPHVASEAR